MFNQQQLKTLQNIIAKRISYKSKAKWLVKFSTDTGIGLIKSGMVSFGIKDIKGLESYLLANDYPIESNLSDFSDRIESSKSVGNEKITNNPVTHDRVLALFPEKDFFLDGEIMPKGRAMDMTVAEVLSLDFKSLVIVENLAVFLNAYHYPNLLSVVHRDSIIVFRGMAGCYSTKGTVKLLNDFTGEKVGFFDFDPAGISALGHKQFDSILVPCIQELSLAFDQNRLVSDPSKFFSQANVNVHVYLNNHADFMEKNRLAVSQEFMIAKDFKLQKVKLD